MICYLTGQTWTSGEASTAFALEVEQAMDAGVSLLLVHEMSGVGGQAARHACEFGDFFACDDGATPEELLRRGIYSQIATPLKGSEWRKASMVMIALNLANDPSAPVEEEALPVADREPTQRQLTYQPTRGVTVYRAGTKARRMPTRRPSQRFESHVSHRNLPNDLEVPPALAPAPAATKAWASLDA